MSDTTNLTERDGTDMLRMHMIIRRFAGIFILVSLVLARFHSPHWLWFTAFVGFNLLQSSFTNFCPLEMILKKFGVAASSSNTEKSNVWCTQK
jgi:hypothetical protein